MNNDRYLTSIWEERELLMRNSELLQLLIGSHKPDGQNKVVTFKVFGLCSDLLRES